MGLPLSYQPSALTWGTSLNSPPGRSSSTNTSSTRVERPIFRANPKRNLGWKKSFTVVDISRSGELFEKFQLHLTLQEDNANVDMITDLLKGQLGYEVNLIDCKRLPVLSGETTSGKQL